MNKPKRFKKKKERKGRKKEKEKEKEKERKGRKKGKGKAKQCEQVLSGYLRSEEFRDSRDVAVPTDPDVVFGK